MQVGTIVKCFDFPNRTDCYMIGEVIDQNDYSIKCRAIKVVMQNEPKVVEPEMTFTTSKQGQGMFDDRFERVVVLG